ncbi:hypothetical protein P3W45_001434 [Vairimorpha bombi]|jgi:UDP-N-acetylglucosamine pyrophosphorylase
MLSLLNLICCTIFLKTGEEITTMEIINSKSGHLIKLYDSKGNLTEKGQKLYDIGMNALLQNKFGVVILSGGQGTRLGTNDPKGMYKIAGKTLFEYHVDKIKSLHPNYKKMIRLLVMTSDHTHDKVVEYFIENEYFDLDVVFFKQDHLPCTYESGEAIQINGEVVISPNGNGNIFKSIRSVDIDDLYAINVVSVDNILSKILNPEFVGAFVDNNLDILSKSVTKLPDENVGVFVKNNGKMEIKEYSEIVCEEADCEGNICNHLFKTSFVQIMGHEELSYHKVVKKIPRDLLKQITNLPSYLEDDRDKENLKCLKYESFIFDCFKFTNKNQVLNVPREDEFAPLKNGLNSSVDNPKTCEEAFEKYKKKRSSK